MYKVLQAEGLNEANREEGFLAIQAGNPYSGRQMVFPGAGSALLQAPPFQSIAQTIRRDQHKITD